MQAPQLTLINLYEPVVTEATVCFNFDMSIETPTVVSIPTITQLEGVSFDIDLSNIGGQSNTFGVPKSMNFSLQWLTPAEDGFAMPGVFWMYIFDTQQLITLRAWCSNTLTPMADGSAGQGQNSTVLTMSGCIPIITGSTGLFARIVGGIDFFNPVTVSIVGKINLCNFEQHAWMSSSN